MQVDILKKHHIPHWISGLENDVRHQNVGDQGLRENIQKIIDAMKVTPDEIYTGAQSHENNVAYCTGKNGDDYAVGKNFPDTDGLLTAIPGTAMWVKFADCTPVVLYDSKHHVLSIVHSGWRGTVARISEKALLQMKERFDTKVEDLIAYVGPSIDQDHYEVGREVYEAFEDFHDRDQFFYPKGEKYHLSMTAANVSILKENGIPDRNMEISTVSTYTDNLLHSSRKEGKDYSLNGMMVMLPENNEL